MKNRHPKLNSGQITLTSSSMLPVRFGSIITTILLFVTLAPSRLFAQVPVISYSSPQTYNLNSTITPLSPTGSGVAAPAYGTTLTGRGTGYHFPSAVTVDASDDIYIADSYNGVIKEIYAGTNTPVIIGTGFGYPTGVVVDATGNVYVTDAETYLLKKIPAGGGTVVNIGSTVGWGNGLAIDASGNIFLAVANGNSGFLAEIKAGTSNLVTLIPNLIPQGVAVDKSGNVYFTDSSNNLLKELPANGGAVVTLASGFNSPSGITVDAAGNLYVTDSGSKSIKEIPAGGGTPIVINSSFEQPGGIALTAAGDIIVTDAGNSTVSEIPRTGGYFLSPLLPAGLTFNNATGVISGTPTKASPATNYTVTANNSSGQATAAINITVLTNNINLSHLTLSTGTLTPAFATATRNYKVSVSNVATSIKVTPTAGDPTEMITVNGTTVASGSASPDITVNFGTSTITVDAKSSDGTIIDTYNLTLTRIPSSNAALSNLTINSGTLSPAFAAATSDYTGEVSSSTTGVMVTPTASDPTATITVNGTSVASGAASANIPLSIGVNPINIVVTAQDGTTIRDYTVSVTRPPGGLSVSYGSPQTYTVGFSITPLVPVSSGVAPLAHGAPITIGSGFNNPRQAAADATGNVYVADKGNNAIKKIPAGGGTPVVFATSTGLNGVAVDLQGNVYTNNGSGIIAGVGYVKEFSASGGAVISSNNQVGNSGIAVDAQGNVYTTYFNNSYAPIEVLPPGLQSVKIVGQGDFAVGVAVDNSGNIFFGNAGGNLPPGVGEIPKIAGAPTLSNLNVNYPVNGVAVDCAGNVFGSPDQGSNPISLTEFPADGSAPVNFGSGFYEPYGLSIDIYGNIYVADAGNNAIKEIKQTGGYYISGLPPGLTFDENTGIISGTPTAITAAANYTVTVYNGSGSATAALNIEVVPPPPPVISYSSPQSYVVGTAITPLTPGTGGYVAPFAYSKTFTSAASNSGNYNFASVTQPAVDAAGNLYVGMSNSATIFKLPAGSNTIAPFGTGFSSPVGVAVDAAGNVYVADATTQQIIKIPAGGGAQTTMITGLTSPSRLAIDAAGNIYVLDNGIVKKYTGGTGTPVTLGSGLINPVDIAVDAVGNLDVLDIGNNAVKEISASTGNTITLATLAPVINATFAGLALDGGGNIFVCSVSGVTAGVVEIPAGGGTSTAIGGVFHFPVGLVIDKAGNIYITLTQLGGEIGEFKPIGGYYISGLPAGLSFNQTTGVISGAPTLPSPSTNYTVTAYNVDNSGSTTVNIKVTANPVTLASLTLSSGPLSPSFVSTTNNYTAANAGIATTSVTVTPTASDPTETITVDGITTPSGSASQPITLAEGTNTITIIVKSHDGTLSNTYSIVMTHMPSPIATLSNIAVSTGTLGPAFVSTTTSYADTVAYATTSITVTPTVSFPTATVKVNGTAVASGSASGDISLSMGSNTIHIAVTAEDGTTMAAYTVLVWRPYMTLVYNTPDTYMQSVPIMPLVPQSLNVTPYTQVYISRPAPGLPQSSAIDSQYPSALACDNSGYLYEVVGYNVEKVTTAGIVVLGSGFNAPGDIAVDASGNVYVAEQGNNAIKMIPVGGGAVVTLGSGFSSPYGVAVDGQGNVFVSDSGNGAIKEIPAGGGSVITLLSGLENPMSIAVDQNDNLYIADVGDGKLLKLPANGSTPIVMGSGYDTLELGDIRVDAAGNVYTFNVDHIWQFPAGGGKANVIFAEDLYDFINGLAVLPNGTVITTDIYVYVEPIAPALVAISSEGGYHLSSFLPKGLTFSDVTGIISGTPAISMPAANYTVSAYDAISYVSANVNITIKPLGPPTFSYNSPNTFIQGAAIAPLSPTSIGVSPPGYATTAAHLGSGFTEPAGVAVDASGNAFVADWGNKLVKKIAPGGSPATFGSGITQPYGIAVNAAGDVFVADYGSNSVKKIPVAGGSAVVVGTGFMHPMGLAVDAAGNVYVADYGNNAVKKITAGSGTIVTLGSGFNLPTGVAVDNLGNVYVADFGNNAVKMIPAGRGAVVPLGAFSGPRDIAFDGGGNMYVTEYTTNDLKEVKADGSSIVLASHYNRPLGLALDGAGNLYVADFSNNVIDEYNPTGGFFITPFLPAGLTFSTITGTISGTPVTLAPPVNYAVTAYNSSGSGSGTVSIAIANNSLSNLTISNGALTPAFTATTTSYTVSVGTSVSSVTLTPTTTDPGATVTVNGTAVTSGTASAPVPLSIGPNPIPVVVTPSGPIATKTYTVTVGYGATNANLSALTLSTGALSPAFASGTTSYTTTVANAVTSLTVTPTVSDPNAAIKVNGVTVASGTASSSIPLAAGPNTITTVVTAQDGVTTNTYSIVVTRTPSSNAGLTNIKTSPTSTLLLTSGPGYFNFKSTVPNSFSSIQVIVTPKDNTATITVNGQSVASGSPSQVIPLSVGSNTLTTVITAQDGVTTETIIIYCTRSAPPSNNSFYEPVSVAAPPQTVTIASDGLIVHKAVSPNGDGVNDVFTIDGLTSYRNNKVTIIDRNGNLVYEAKSYDNSSVVFDGHSNVDGKMQAPGTYFYSLEYKVGNMTKRQTGYIILKY